MKIATPLLLLLALVLGGCSAFGDSTASTDGVKAAINSVCPMSGEAVSMDCCVEYDGNTIAFCCEECMTKFNEMSDEEKQEEVKRILASATED